MTKALEGKTALVVGADSGIGLAAARSIAEAGARLVIGGLDKARGEAIAREISQASGQEVAFFPVDVREEETVRALVEEARRKLGRIDVALNNAGVEGPTGPIHEMKAADFDNLMSVNVRGMWLSMKYEIPVMLAQKSGSIVNLASTAGVKALPNVAIYAATKHAVIGMTKSAAVELAATGVRVNAIGPGPVNTGLLERMTRGRNLEIDAIAARVPMQRISEPEEIARVIVFMASDAASFVTGTTFFVDGGHTAL